MYIQRILYDISCNFENNSSKTSADPNATFNLTKDFLYVVPNDIITDGNLIEENHTI